MANTLKLLGSELNLSTTANNVGFGQCVRVLNTDTAVRVVTVKDGSTTTGTVTLGAGEAQNIVKKPSDTLEVVNAAGTKVKAVSIAFSN